MTVHLPTPYPDELLYGVISRLVVRTGWSGSLASLQVFGASTPCSVDLPGRLDAAAANIGPSATFTGEEILQGLTLFPYYAAGVSPSAAAEVASMLRSGAARGAHARLGLTAQSVKRPWQLRFCPACREEDLRTLGETYWRRSHQLPGVVACAWHPRMLVGTGLPMSRAASGGFMDATEVLRCIPAPAERFGVDAVAPAHEAAVRCAALLAHPERVATIDACRELARAKGFVGVNGGLDHARMEHAVASFFGPDLLDAFGLKSDMSGSGLYWVRKHVVEFRHSACPATGVLVAMALEALPDVVPGIAPPRPRAQAALPRPFAAGELGPARARWRRVVEAAPVPRITRARRTHGYLAARLRTWDREWYDRFNARHRVPPRRSRGSRRDRETLRVLVKATEELRAKSPDRRLSKSAIIAGAGLHRNRIAGLPRCEAFLREAVETTLEHRRRKLARAASEIVREGRRPTASSLAEVSGIGWSAVADPALEDVVRTLCLTQ